MMKGELPSALTPEPVIPQDGIKKQLIKQQGEDTPRNGKPQQRPLPFDFYYVQNRSNVWYDHLSSIIRRDARAAGPD
jgi:hypothetical protein